MGTEANRIIQKLWSYCTVLRDDGLSYGDYLEQLSVLLFLKLAHEQTQQPWPSDHREPLRCLASRQAATQCTPPRKWQRRHLC
jgi:type I restriction-modification system DNA methylase subunit